MTTAPGLVSPTDLCERLGIASLEGRSSFELGRLHESRLRLTGARKRRGSFYTPDDVVEGLLDVVLEPLLRSRRADGLAALLELRIVDPACGTGNFLGAAARRLAQALQAAGLDHQSAAAWAFGRCVVGIDTDPEAVEICRYVLHRESGGLAAVPDLHRNVRVADSLVDDRILEESRHGYDLVIGNPPFLSQLSGETSQGSRYRAELKRRFGDVVLGYTDPAAIFLLLGARLAREDGGVICMVQPISFVGVRDAAPIRSALLKGAGLRGLWIAEEQLFDASVEVCAPVLERGRSGGEVALWTGRRVSERSVLSDPDLADSWSTLLAEARGVPRVHLAHSAGVLGDLVSATADFRDQFYGVAPHVVDSAEGDGDLVRLVTVGLIDPAWLKWGSRNTRVGGRRFLRPRVRVSDLEPELRRWAGKRLVPKILLATQSRALEVIVDEAGDLLPSVPVITLTTADPRELWRLAAVLTSPPVLAWALHEYAGAALTGAAVKLSARQVERAPLPIDPETWSRGAAAFRAASDAVDAADREGRLLLCGREMCSAYGIAADGELFRWWAGRMGIKPDP